MAVALAIIVALAAALLVFPSMIFAIAGRAAGVPGGEVAVAEDSAPWNGTAGHRAVANRTGQFRTVSRKISS